jgi:general secretion pathway protein A
MYESFFGLTEKPFNIAPDSRYLYLSASHREALAHLVYGIEEKKGFIVFTGPVGSGKTTILHVLLENFDTRVRSAFIFYSKLSFRELLRYILDEFGIETKPETVGQYLVQLNQFLVDLHGSKQTAVLVIDEAQNLSLELLEDIRMLGNLEIEGEKLLQVILSGQPELHSKLYDARLYQLRQRIGICCEIRGLSFAETRKYVQHRLSVAGGDPQSVFSYLALKSIYAYTDGIPRLIHTVCDHALLSGWTTRRRWITCKTVKKVRRDLNYSVVRRLSASTPKRVATLLTTMLLLEPNLPLSWLFVRDNMQRQEQYRNVRETAETPIITVDKWLTDSQREWSANVQNKIDFPLVIKVKKGDKISKLSIEVYGSVNSDILDHIKRNNPHIKSIDNIEIGDVIFFQKYYN